MTKARELSQVAALVTVDTNNKITFSSSSEVEIGGLLLPSSDGTPGQALITDGSGTLSFGGVDADLLDGINSSSFLRSDTTDTFSSTLTYSGQGGTMLKAYSIAGDIKLIQASSDSSNTTYGFDIIYEGSGSGIENRFVLEMHNEAGPSVRAIDIDQAGQIDFALSPEVAGNTLLDVGDIGVSVQGYSSVLANTTASFTTADEAKLDGLADYTYVRSNFTATADQTTFTVAYTVGYVDVYMNGVKLVIGTDFTATNGTSIVLTSGLVAGDLIEVVAFETFSVANALTTSDLGVTVQAYDADTTKNDVANTFTANQTFDNGIIEEYNATGTSGAVTIDLNTGNNFSTAMAGAVTYTFSNPAASGKVSSFTLKVVNDGNAITWPTSVDWPAGTAPTLSASGATDYFVFITHDGGTTWYGFTAGQAMA